MILHSVQRFWILALIICFITAFPTRATILLVGEDVTPEIQEDWKESYLNGAYRLRKLAYTLLAALTGTGLFLLKDNPSREPNEPFSF